ILFIFNAQHDCFGSRCQAIARGETMMQERRATGLTQTAIHHKETEIFFINMHALHNAHLIRETLPRDLTAPIPFFLDRGTKHGEFADLVRVSGPAK
ncbi:hypothetical protein B0H11DRAFT_1622565, partial [Mycena galericulata]